MISLDRPHLFISSATHEGMSGKNNEDRFGVFAFQRAADDPTPVVFAVLCDGIGGHRAGEVAAELAVETIHAVVARSQADQPQAILQQGILAASQAILDQTRQAEERMGMGATCVCAWVIADRLYTASVGDSRLYLLRNGSIRQLTIDHTWVQEAMEYGLLTPEQASRHPHKHVIRRYLGSEESSEVDFRLKLDPAETAEQSLSNQGMQLQPGDCLVLCSDGLSDLVTAEEVLHAVQAEKRGNAPQALVKLANERGGHDNITVVLLEYPYPGQTRLAQTQPARSRQEEPEAAPIPISQAAPPQGKTGKQLAGISCLIIGAGAVLVFLLALALLWYLSSIGILHLPWEAATPTATPPILNPPAITFPSETPLPSLPSTLFPEATPPPP